VLGAHRQGLSSAVIGNPGAGSVKGSGLEEQAFFRKCVASGGKIGDDNAPE
jgi:hypothetical protein